MADNLYTLRVFVKNKVNKFFMNNFAHKLKSARQTKGLTQVQLAAASHISQRVVSQWENGKRPRASYQLIQKLAAALEIPVTDLIGEPPGLGASLEQLER